MRKLPTPFAPTWQEAQWQRKQAFLSGVLDQLEHDYDAPSSQLNASNSYKPLWGLNERTRALNDDLDASNLGETSHWAAHGNAQDQESQAGVTSS